MGCGYYQSPSEQVPVLRFSSGLGTAILETSSNQCSEGPSQLFDMDPSLAGNVARSSQRGCTLDRCATQAYAAVLGKLLLSGPSSDKMRKFTAHGARNTWHQIEPDNGWLQHTVSKYLHHRLAVDKPK